MPVSQKEFEKVRGKLRAVGDTGDLRDWMWEQCRRLLERGDESVAYILLLATWNFAGFRFIMTTLRLSEFEKALKMINSIFDSLADKVFEGLDFEEDKDLRKNIKIIYEELKKKVKQTGATKLMALKNPNLFVMWDTEIRRMYHINNRGSGDDHLQFLIKMKQEFGHIKLPPNDVPLAKAIDEYNYVLAEKNRRERKSKTAGEIGRRNSGRSSAQL